VSVVGSQLNSNFGFRRTRMEMVLNQSFDRVSPTVDNQFPGFHGPLRTEN
jgi:hypothetical protein